AGPLRPAEEQGVQARAVLRQPLLRRRQPLPHLLELGLLQRPLGIQALQLPQEALLPPGERGGLAAQARDVALQGLEPLLRGGLGEGERGEGEEREQGARSHSSGFPSTSAGTVMPSAFSTVGIRSTIRGEAVLIL